MGRILLTAIGLAAFAVLMPSSAGAQADGDLARGKRTYRTYCIVCHAPRGQGSPAGKSLLTADARQKSDTEILGIITRGVPGTAMTEYGSGLSEDEIRSVVLYVRDLQDRARARDKRYKEPASQAAIAMSGEAGAGEALFNGAAGCVQCHRYGNRGGRLGPDLSGIGTRMSLEEIRTAVLQPSAHINPDYRCKDMQLIDGTRVEGVVRNETNDSIELANEKAADRYLKSDISRMRDGWKSLMPHDYARKLTVEQQEQIFAFLSALK